MVSDLPEGAVGDLTLPVLRRALADALVEHTQRRLELARENGLEVVDHGSHSRVSASRLPSILQGGSLQNLCHSSSRRGGVCCDLPEVTAGICNGRTAIPVGRICWLFQ